MQRNSPERIESHSLTASLTAEFLVRGSNLETHIVHNAIIIIYKASKVYCFRNVMAHGDAREGK